MCGSTCFGSLPAHHQERTTALGASGFTVGAWRLERCWSWSGRFFSPTVKPEAPSAVVRSWWWALERGGWSVAVRAWRLELCWSWSGRFFSPTVKPEAPSAVVRSWWWALERGGWSVVGRGLAGSFLQWLNQRILMQLYAPDDGRGDARNMLSHT